MMKQPVGFANLSKLGAEDFPLSPWGFLGGSTESKCSLLWKHLGTTGMGGWMGGWMEGRQESCGLQTLLSDLLFMTTGISTHSLD